MSNKLTLVIVCIISCFAVSLTLPHLDKSNYLFADEEEKIEGHMGVCMDCHFLDSIHNNSGHGGPNDCDLCHDGGAVTGNVKATSCTECHPEDNPGKCSLANFHAYDACLRCHYKCSEDNVTTTSVPASSHINICSECHLSYDLHTNEGHHKSCSDCHEGEAAAGNVKAEKCSVCHPVDNAGKCELTVFHDGASCSTCHSECEEDNGTTSTIPTAMHIGLCSECHTSADLHANASHIDCALCHNGASQAGNVEADSCITSECHPVGDPGKCSLVETDNHRASTCVNCHFDCGKDSATKSAPDNSTQTPAFSTHIDLCSSCHYENDLHANKEHSVCTLCHDISFQGESDAGPVTATSCTACHPVDNPEKCNLTSFHSNSTCLTCHFECLKQTVPTSSTTTAQGSTTTTIQTPTTTTSTPPCPSAVALSDNNKGIDTLRSFRDNVLANSQLGRFYISLYYRHAGEITAMMLSEESLRTRTANVLALLLPELEKNMADGETSISPEIMAELAGLLDNISAEADLGLKLAIRQAKADMQNITLK